MMDSDEKMFLMFCIGACVFTAVVATGCNVSEQQRQQHEQAMARQGYCETPVVGQTGTMWKKCEQPQPVEVK